MQRLLASLQRSDVRKNPLLALWKRIRWKLRWRLMQAPFKTRLYDGTPIWGAKTGSTALIYYQGISEPETMTVFLRWLKPDAVVFDLGAHIGEYALVAARHAPQGKVYAFEPQPDLVAVIKKNTQQQGFNNVSIHPYALSDQIGKVAFSVPHERTMAALVSDPSVVASYEVAATTIDAFCQEYQINQINLIKIDIEGAELLALKGAVDLLSKPPTVSPVILFEYNPHTYSRFGYDIKDVRVFLTQYGYSLYQFDEIWAYSLLDVDQLNSNRCNLIAAKDTLM